MRRLWLIALLMVGLAAPVHAQSDQADDDRGFLIGLIEDTLSSAGRDVRITGFRGALSSRATLDTLTIADDDGVWLTLRGAVLDWNRSALLSGRLEVNELSAEAIDLPRLPAADETPPSPEAQGFSIPELPVSVQIGTLRIDRVSLGEPVIGEPAVLSVEGSAKLADGDADIDFKTQRLDADGQIDLALSFVAETEELAIGLSLEEAPDGIAANLLGLPGLPSVTLLADGAGPLSDFDLTFDLNTDGADRVDGTAKISEVAEGRRFAGQLQGDITALVLEDYEEFFGPDTRLSATGLAAQDGAVLLDDLTIRSAALSIAGSAAVAPGGAPVRFALTGQLRSEDGETVTLPFGSGLRLDSATVDLSFDADKGEDWTGRFDLTNFVAPGLVAETLNLTAVGTIGTEAPAAFSADLDFLADGLKVDDPALGAALGPRVTGKGAVRWEDGAPVSFEAFRLEGESYGLTANATLDAGTEAALVDVSTQVRIDDLAILAPLAGQPLRGAAMLDVTAEADLLAGSFDVAVEGGAQGLSVGIEPVDRLVSSPAQLGLRAVRDETGLSIPEFRLANDQLSLEADGKLITGGSSFNYSARLANSAVFTDGDRGPISLQGALTQTGETIVATLQGGGDRIGIGNPTVDALFDGSTQLDAAVEMTDGQITLRPSRIETPEARIGAQGTLTPGAIALALDGRLNNSALFTGGQAGGADFDVQVNEAGSGVFDVSVAASGTDLGIGTPSVDRFLRGRTLLDAQFRLADGQVLLRPSTAETPVGTLMAEGNLTPGALVLQANGRLPNSAVFTGGQAGPLTFEAMLREIIDEFSITMNANGQNIGIGTPAVDQLLRGTSAMSARARTEGETVIIESVRFDGSQIDAEAEGRVAGDTGGVTFDARLADVGLFTDALSGPATAQGRADLSGELVTLDITATGPGGAAAAVDGTFDTGPGTANLSITGTAPLGLADRLIAPRTATGTARFDLRLAGQPGLGALSGTVSTQGAQVIAPTFGLVVEPVNAEATLSNGRANLRVDASVGGGQATLTGPITLGGALPADLTLALRGIGLEDPALYATSIGGDLRITGPLTGGGSIAGEVRLGRTELRVPSSSLGGVEAIPDVTHLGAPADVEQTRMRAGLVAEDDDAAGGGAVFGLDVALNATAPIFIRGRGLDAELGGRLRVSGTTADIVTVGQFALVRGRLDILGQRLVLTEGSAQLAGSFDPYLRLVAETESGDITVFVTVEGPASAPEVSFRSSPELPEDEVLARLLFGKSITSISPLQAAQLASAIAELTGRGNGGVVARLRDNFGLDNLDVTSDGNGNAAVTAGSYINENVYTEVEVGSDGTTDLSINLDIIDNVTVKGKAGSDGDTGIGIFFERDY